MKSISEFEKLYKVNIPVQEEFPYYLELLLQSKEYDWLPEAIADFELMEDYVLTIGKTVTEYKRDKMNELIDYIASTKTYEAFQNFDIRSLPAPYKKDLRKKGFHEDHDENTTFLSIDIVSANYSTMKAMFDKENELCDSWMDLMRKNDLHISLAKSKSFRQYIFGNLNPNRNQSLQQNFISGIAKAFDDLVDNEKEKTIYVTHDEIIIPLNGSFSLSQTQIKAFINNHIKSKYEFELPLKYSTLKIERIEDRRKIYIEQHLDESGSLKHKSLFGVPGPKFYMYFKKYILNQELENRDLYFENDGSLAQWVV